jgi:hypothetical protein
LIVVGVLSNKPVEARLDSPQLESTFCEYHRWSLEEENSNNNISTFQASVKAEDECIVLDHIPPQTSKLI